MKTEKKSVVSSYNEWDMLEEVIVGDVRGAVIPVWDEVDYAAHHPSEHQVWYDNQNKPFPPDHVEHGIKCVNELVRILEGEGVKVRRPTPIAQDRPYSAPGLEWPSGFNIANPRDVLLVVGEEIIEAPTPRRGRYWEINAYKELLKEYSEGGGKWISAPRPILDDESYRPDCHADPGVDLLMKPGEQMQSPLAENEPMWEAADFMRCGRDIFYHRSYVTNQAGVDWLRRHLGDGFTFHEIDTRCRRPVHIDTTFVPLAPGKAIANPAFAPVLPDILKKWDVLYTPTPTPAPNKSPYQFGSDWLGMNVFSIDAERVLVDKNQEALIAKLKDWGMKPIPIEYHGYYPFGGGLHCSTLDVRRTGTLESYF